MRIEVPVAPAVIDAMNEAQAVLCSWARSGAWPAALPFDQPIEIAAPVGEPGRLGAGTGTAAFFSGGVDSFATVLRHPEITHLVHIEGFDVPLSRTDLATQVRSRLAAAAADLGKELIVVRMQHPRALGSACRVGDLLWRRSGHDRDAALGGDVEGDHRHRDGLRHPVRERLPPAARPSLGRRPRRDRPRRCRPQPDREARAAGRRAGRARGASSLLAEPRRRLQLRPLREVPAHDGAARGSRRPRAVRDLPRPARSERGGRGRAGTAPRSTSGSTTSSSRYARARIRD